MTYSPKGETVDLKDSASWLAVDRLVKKALPSARETYGASLGTDVAYKSLLSGVEQARIRAAGLRKTAAEFGSKAKNYANRGKDPAKRRAALLDAQRYDRLAGAEEESTISLKNKLDIRREELWENALGVTADGIDYSLESLEAEVLQEIMADINARLDTKVAEERRAAVEAHRPYLDGIGPAAQDVLGSLFGDVYSGDTIVLHVDGKLDHTTPVIIYTEDPDKTRSRLPNELKLPDDTRLTLGGVDQIPLNDGSGTSILEVQYSGSKKLH